MKELRVYRCETCGKSFVMIRKSGCPTMCCGNEMKLLEPNTTDAAVEKHVPVVTREGNVLTVSVGTVEHPMTEEHYIEYVILESENGFRLEHLKPTDKPEVRFLADEKVEAVYAYCNLHGLWKTAI